MRDYRDAKDMARTLREVMAADGHEITHSAALEIVARQFGLRDWNLLAAELARPRAPVQIRGAIPLLRIFDEAKARAFYEGFLGFGEDWQHRFGDEAPLYCQMSRNGCLLHLTEHHGDASPAATCFVPMEGAEAFHAELTARPYRHNRPGLERMPWGLQVEVTDPFGNRLRFCEQRHG